MAAAPYTTPERVRDMLSRANDARPGTAASLADTEAWAAIGRASTKINARLGRIYATPFNPVPQLVIQITEAFSAYDLDLTFREVRDYSSELNPVLLRFREHEQLLRDLATGAATLPDYVPPDEDPGIPDNPRDGGSIVGIFNPPRETPYGGHRCGSGCMCGYYGWGL